MYQNPHKPRFYIPYGNWWRAAGGYVAPMFCLDPYQNNNTTFTGSNEGGFQSTANFSGFADPYGQRGIMEPFASVKLHKYDLYRNGNFIFILNHNLGRAYETGIEQQFRIKPTINVINENFIKESTADFVFDTLDTDKCINIENSGNNLYHIPYNGWSLFNWQEGQGMIRSSSYDDNPGQFTVPMNHLEIRLALKTINNQIPMDTQEFNIGCMVFGESFDLLSPELKITMTRQTEGIRRSKSPGGQDLLQYKYLNAPMWTNAGLNPWELSYQNLGGESETNLTPKEFIRLGRRTWRLSFKGVNVDKIEPKYNLPNHIDTEEWDAGDESDSGELALSHYNSNTLIGKILNRLQGGRLPFIFQPNKDDFSIQNFAICKFNMSSFKFNQTGFNTYRFDLNVEEIW